MNSNFYCPPSQVITIPVDFIIERRPSKQSKLKGRLKPSPGKAVVHSPSHASLDCMKAIQKRRKETENAWKQKCDNSKKKLDSLFGLLSNNLKNGTSKINTQELLMTLKQG